MSDEEITECDCTTFKCACFVEGLEAELSQAKAALAEAQSRLDATLVAALRYESRHDLDLERGKLWGELKEALMVYRLQSPPKSEPSQEMKP